MRASRLTAMAVLGLASALATLGGPPGQPAEAAPPAVDYEMPFRCGQKWVGTTRAGHSPSVYSVDFNRPGDLGARLVASAPAVVDRVARLGNRSYGTYVILDHGGGETSLYAHLQDTWLLPGQRVDQGTLIGRVGESGNVTGAHLHYEQRHNGSVHQAYFNGSAYVMGTNQASKACSDTPVAGDWDRDGVDEVGVFRRKARGRFRQAMGAGPVPTVTLGQGTDEPMTGDWDGDGTVDLGVRRPLNNRFVLRRDDGTKTKFSYGARGDRPVAGDWDGDGRSEVGVWRPSNATFRLRDAEGRTSAVALGETGSHPVSGDWNGDGRTDVGVYTPARRTWSLRMEAVDGTVWTAEVGFGAVTDLPVTGDWDGDGITDLGTWSPATATFGLRTADRSEPGEATVTTRRFGDPR